MMSSVLTSEVSSFQKVKYRLITSWTAKGVQFIVVWSQGWGEAVGYTCVREKSHFLRTMQLSVEDSDEYSFM